MEHSLPDAFGEDGTVDEIFLLELGILSSDLPDVGPNAENAAGRLHLGEGTDYGQSELVVSLVPA